MKDAARKPQTAVTATATERLLRVSHPLVARNVTRYTSANANPVAVLAWFGCGQDEQTATRLGEHFRRAMTEAVSAALVVEWWRARFLVGPRLWTAWNARDVPSPWVTASSQLVLITVRDWLGLSVKSGGTEYQFPSSLEVFCARCGDRYESGPPHYAQTCGCRPSKVQSKYRQHVSGAGAFPLSGVYRDRWVWPGVECRDPGCGRRFDAYRWNECYCPEHKGAKSRVAAGRARRGNAAA